MPLATDAPQQTETIPIAFRYRSRSHLQPQKQTLVGAPWITTNKVIELKYEALSALLDMVELQGVHDGVGIAKAIIKVLANWEIEPIQVGVTVSDNASNNDSTVKEIVRQLFPS